MTTNPEIIVYDDPNDFLDDIGDYVDSNHFSYFLFIKAIDRLLDRKESIYNALTIKKNNQIEIIYIWTNHCQYIFGDINCNESITLILSKINFETTKTTGLFGNKIIIDKIIEKSDYSFNLIKHRLYYSCYQPKKPSIVTNCILHIADISDFDEISSLGLEFYKEEFKGKGKKTDDQVIEGIYYGINEKMIFYLKDNKDIVSYLQIIDTRNNKFMIGSVFTEKKYRGQGYGKTLIYKVIEKIQTNENIEFGFIVSPENLASINMFSSIGFQKTYETGLYEYNTAANTLLRENQIINKKN